MASNIKQMESKVKNLVNCLGNKHGFDVDKAFEYIQNGTDVNHLLEILKMIDVTMEPTKNEEVAKPNELDEKIAVCKKNIALWEKKLNDGKAKDKVKQQEKIDKEKKKLAKLEEKAPKPKPVEKPKEEPKKEEKPKEEPKKKEEKEKRIKRFSPVMASQLKKAVEDVGLEMGDKLKKEFQQYIEDLTDDDYRKEGLADHMRTFAKLKAPPKVEKDDDKPPPLEGDEEEEDEEDMPKPPSVSNVSLGGPGTNKPEPEELSLDELQKIGVIASVDPPGTFWDADNGRFVKGPDADDDEDVTDVKFEGKDYVVGEKTGRVYEARDTGDFFAGFCGVGKFKSMKRPA